MKYVSNVTLFAQVALEVPLISVFLVVRIFIYSELNVRKIVRFLILNPKLIEYVSFVIFRVLFVSEVQIKIASLAILTTI